MLFKEQYKDWSKKFHISHDRKPLSVHIELTYRCPLHCRHCYTDCYNKPNSVRNELDTSRIKCLLDKLQASGVVWLNFTGGDPLMRKDFNEIYIYAQKKGFIVSVMTSLSRLPKEIFKTLNQFPPFSIEMSFNAARRQLFEQISGVSGSFEQTRKNIAQIKDAKINLKIKTILSKLNISQLSEIRKLIESYGCTFHPSALLFARLNGDRMPCEYRLSFEELYRHKLLSAYKCAQVERAVGFRENVFTCVHEKWQWHIDPSGKMFICPCIRTPCYNVLNLSLKTITERLVYYMKNRRYTSNSECRYCTSKAFCPSCPGIAMMEFQDEEAVVPYYCYLTRKILQVSHS